MAAADRCEEVEISVFTFLVADTQLCKRLCPSVRPSVMVIELKSGKTSAFDTFYLCLSVVDGGWMPLPTLPQRYCDPASLVNLHFIFLQRLRAEMKCFGKGRNHFGIGNRAFNPSGLITNSRFTLDDFIVSVIFPHLLTLHSNCRIAFNLPNVAIFTTTKLSGPG